MHCNCNSELLLLRMVELLRFMNFELDSNVTPMLSVSSVSVYGLPFAHLKDCSLILVTRPKTSRSYVLESERTQTVFAVQPNVYFTFGLTLIVSNLDMDKSISWCFRPEVIACCCY
jgi:hypothetical protein